MNSRTALLGLSIILGVVVGGYLGSVYSEFLLGGVMLGGLLGGLLYYVIYWALSQRNKGLIPYDSLDERQQISHNGKTQTPEARVTGMQDSLMNDLMRFNKPPQSPQQ